VRSRYRAAFTKTANFPKENPNLADNPIKKIRFYGGFFVITGVLSGVAVTLQSFNDTSKDTSIVKLPGSDKTESSQNRSIFLRSDSLGPSKGALSKLKNVNSDVASARKAAARMRIAQLKQQIEFLQKLAGSVEIPVHLINRLARELKSLVAMYGSSSGGGGGSTSPVARQVSVATAESPTATGETPAEPGISTEPTDIVEAIAESVADPVAGPVPIVNAGNETIEQAEEAPVNPFATTQSGVATLPDEQHQAEKNRTNISALSERIKAHQKNSEADALFFLEARRLAQMLKNILEVQKARAKKLADQEEIKKARKALEDLDKAIAVAEKTAADENTASMKAIFAEVANHVSQMAGVGSVALASTDSALYNASGVSFSPSVSSLNILVDA